MLKFSSQVSQVPQGVLPPAQLFSVPNTFRPVGSAEVLSKSCPAAGPEKTMGVLTEMRRAYLLSPTTFHPAPSRAISTTEPPIAAISISDCVLVDAV